MKLKNQGRHNSLKSKRVWVGSKDMSTSEKEKQFPYVDLSVATKNRAITRDPIAGIGDLPKEHVALAEGDTPRRQTGKQNRVYRDPVSGQGQLGQESNIFYSPRVFKPKQRSERNPITSDKVGTEADHLRPHGGKPGKVVIRQDQRDPISGYGKFGREWDPVWKYDGRPRPWIDRAKPLLFKYDYKYLNDYFEKSGNPVTGEHKNDFIISREFKERTPRTDAGAGNPLTGENCQTFTVSVHAKEKASRASDGHNPLTGENCRSFQLSREEKTRSAKQGSSSDADDSAATPRDQNPLTGDNCVAFAYSKEFKEKMKKEPAGRNVITGDKCESFTVSTEETPRSQKPVVSSNPVTGENCVSYNFTTEDRDRKNASSINGNPLTGKGLQSYDIDLSMRHGGKDGNSRCTPRPALTATNCVAPSPVREQRQHNGGATHGSNGAAQNGHGYNPITGQPKNA